MTSVDLIRAKACVARFEGEIADRVGGNDGRDALAADGEHDLGEQALDGDFEDGAQQLIASADAAARRCCAGGAGTPPARRWECGDGRPAF